MSVLFRSPSCATPILDTPLLGGAGSTPTPSSGSANTGGGNRPAKGRHFIMRSPKTFFRVEQEGFKQKTLRKLQEQQIKDMRDIGYFL